MLLRTGGQNSVNARLDGPDGSSIIWGLRDPVDSAGGTTGATRCPSQALGLQVIAARAGRSTVENAGGPAAAGLAVGHADGRAGAFDAWLDQPPHHRLRQPWPLAQAALQRHRFRAAASGGRRRRRMAAAPSALRARHGCVRPTRRRGAVPEVPDRSGGLERGRLAGRGEPWPPPRAPIAVKPI